jgi:hypothetical protein
MGMGDCLKCWDGVCSCGWEYLNWNSKGLKTHIKMLQTVLEVKEELSMKEGGPIVVWNHDEKYEEAYKLLCKKLEEHKKDKRDLTNETQNNPVI